jgi:hypothetical protein
VEVGVGAEDETELEVSRITGGPSVFPPKLLALAGGLVGTEEGRLGLFAVSNEINEEACSGRRVVVVGGRVTGG